MTKTHPSISMELFTTQAILIAQLSSPRIEDIHENCFPRLHKSSDSLKVHMIVLTDKF